VLRVLPVPPSDVPGIEMASDHCKLWLPFVAPFAAGLFVPVCTIQQDQLVLPALG